MSTNSDRDNDDPDKLPLPTSVPSRPESPPDASATEARARWAGWQKAHAEALQALQAAEAAYHRLTAEQAFAALDETARVKRRDALARLDELRTRLDEIREHRPPWPV